MLRQSSLDPIFQLVDTGVWGDYVLTAENFITGSLADDDVAVGGYHIGIHRPSASTDSGGTAAGHLRCRESRPTRRTGQTRNH